MQEKKNLLIRYSGKILLWVCVFLKANIQIDFQYFTYAGINLPGVIPSYLKKSIKNLITTTTLCTVVLLYSYFLFFYPFAFNYETDINGQYQAVLIVIAGFTIIAILNIFSKALDHFQFKTQFIITSLLLFLVFSDKYTLGNEYWAVLCSVSLLFVCLLFLPLKIITAFPYLLLALLLTQIGIAFKQMDGFDFNTDNMNVQGSLQNSGVFSCYLVIHLPLLYWMAFQQPVLISGKAGRWLNWLKTLCFIILTSFIAYISYINQSRSAIIGITTAVISHLFFRKGKELKIWFKIIPLRLKFILFSIILIATVGSAWYLFFLKKASAMGRVMKWEIAGNHFTDHLLSGTGIGRFTWYYPQWQAEYFATNSHPPEAYYLSAGESYIIFNEYLQLFQTVGLVGTSCFIVLLYWFFRLRSRESPELLSAIKITVVTLLATGLTTYVLHVNCLLSLLAMCFAVAAKITQRSFAFIHKPMMQIAICLLPLYLTFNIYQQWRAVGFLEIVRTQANSEHQVWKELKKQLQTDGKFLTVYGKWLLENNEPELAVTTLETAKTYFISRSTMAYLSSAYEHTSKFNSAIKSREWIANYLPNRFIPKYELLQLYRRTGDTFKLNKLANTIINMPVKIPSREVEIIKEEAKKILELKINSSR